MNCPPQDKAGVCLASPHLLHSKVSVVPWKTNLGLSRSVSAHSSLIKGGESTGSAEPSVEGLRTKALKSRLDNSRECGFLRRATRPRDPASVEGRHSRGSKICLDVPDTVPPVCLPCRLPSGCDSPLSVPERYAEQAARPVG